MASATASMLLGNTLSLRVPRTNLRFSNLHSSSKASSISELGFLGYQLSGIQISSDHLNSARPISAPLKPALQPIVARRVCIFTGKKSNRANKVSFSNHKTKKLQCVNLQYKKLWWEGGKRFLKLRLSTKALKTIEKNGIDAVAKKAGLDLTKM
ncbi:50S ribosomal protein L28, chloroplastic [Linum perenne]